MFSFCFCVFSFPNFCGTVLKSEAFDFYFILFLDIFQVIEIRTMEAPYFLPEHIFRDKCMYVNALHFREGALTWETSKWWLKGANYC